MARSSTNVGRHSIGNRTEASISHWLFERIDRVLICADDFLILFRQYTPEYKMQSYLRIAMLYLEDGDSVEAEAYVNRASLLQNEAKSEELNIRYKVTGFSREMSRELRLSRISLCVSLIYLFFHTRRDFLSLFSGIFHCE